MLLDINNILFCNVLYLYRYIHIIKLSIIVLMQAGFFIFLLVFTYVFTIIFSSKIKLLYMYFCYVKTFVKISLNITEIVNK